MISNRLILNSASISYTPFEGNPEIYISKGNQLFGGYHFLTAFRAGYRDKMGRAYTGWEVHHIVEAQDLDRLGLSSQFPNYESQLCVLLPREAHVGRINNVLRNRNPSRYSATARELLSAYREAYELIGNYSGSNEALIINELMA